ncbi:TIGR04255 family protein [Tritonibacter sp. AK171]|uniref:TIGR04255 family protein n=1 Tax=Tritonibacter sp. AK171 TaxID=3048493 RepID=UPI0024C2487B|nr:TIGR04255 family protein [Tritonibacter sp. AK171]
MEFPERPRVVYGRNPLVEVVCQLRFPRLLLLDREVPSEFQTAIGKDFPIVDSREEVRLSFSRGSQSPTPMSHRQVYDFSTGDKKYIVSLCSDFLAVKTQAYERWEAFHAVLHTAMSALMASYDVPHFTRVGLRYVNVIDKCEIGLEDASWSELLRTPALGLLADNDVSLSDIGEQSSTTLIKLNEGKVVVRTGLHFPSPNEAPMFKVDSDFFLDDQVEGVERATNLLGSYNQAAGNAFRWFITDRLHDQLEPTDP